MQFRQDLVDGMTDQLVRNGKWGSDLAAIHSGCGAGTQLLITESGEAERDGLRAFEIPDRDPIAVSAAAEFDGAAKTCADRSGRDGEFVGILDVGHDIGRLPQRVGSDRLQADGPVAALAGARHADDVELHVAAQRMALKGVSDPVLDLVEGCRRFRKECLEIHVDPLQPQPGVAPATSSLG